MPATTHTTDTKHSTTASRSAAQAVQAKLTVGPSNDTFEQEADRVAGQVVSAGPGPAAARAVTSGPAAMAVPGAAAPTISRLVRRQPAEEPQARLQRQEEEEAQPKVQRQEEEEEEAQPKIQRQEEEEEELQPRLQRQEEEEEELQPKLQRQEEEEEAQPKVQRQEEEEEEIQPKIQRQAEEEEETAQTKAEPRANVRDKRLFPKLGRVEDKLFERKGDGEPLSDETRVEMETGFRADFSGVRVHTDGDAEQMNRDLRAQAFTQGKDVFFAAGKFEPDTVRGKTLLAHELTHVVQQGAAEQKLSEDKVRQNNARKDQPPPAPTDKDARQVEQKTEAEQQERAEQIAQGAGEGGAPAAEGPALEPEVKEERVAPTAEGEAEPKAEGTAEEEGEKAEGQARPAKGGAAEEAGAKAEKKGKAGSVGAHLRNTTKAAVEDKKRKVKQLAGHQKKKDDAATKLAQTEKAVEPPAEEAQSRANASQVDTVEQQPEPEPDKEQAKKAFEQQLDNAVPSSLEEVDAFKERGKGRVVGEAVKGVVAQDTQDVQATYRKIEETPEPAPPPPPEAMPEVEEAPETPALALGEGVVGEVQAEHTDLSDFEEESDALLEEQGITQEQLDMVDEGDLAEANRERQAVQQKVKEGPAEVNQLEQQQKQKVDEDLKKEEEQGRQAMQQERQKELQGARQDQQKTKSTLELKRKAVTDQINAIYEQANTTVQQKLEDLEKQSLKAFDEGQARATKAFEDNVNRRINAFKSERYSGLSGPFLWAKDKLLGMDDLPEVEAIFESEKSTFVGTIDALVEQITRDNERVIQECKDLIADARAKIEEFVAGLGPELQATGQQAMQDMKAKLDALDETVNKKAEALQKKLAEKREAAIKAIEEKIERMKEEMSGLVAKIAGLLLQAALKFFKWALKKAGFDAEQFMGFINKAKAVLEKIVGDPIGFVMNLVRAVRGGIDHFVKNIKKHLIAGLIGWLTGAMADVPIQLPDKWDLKGIIHLVLQILGLTWERIRAKLVKRIGEPVVKAVETTVDIVKRLVAEGPIALWEMIKAKAAEIKQQVMEGIRNWVITQIVKQAVIKLVSFLNPAGAIVQAVIAIYNVIMFFVENLQRILDFAKSVIDSVTDIAAGKIGAAAQFIEQAMAQTIPIILGFLARLIGLGGIGKAVAGIIRKIRRPIDKIVNKVIDRIVGMAKKLLKKAKKGAGKLKDKVVSWWKTKKSFKNKAGESHTLYFKRKGKRGILMIRTTPMEVDDYIKEKRQQLKTNPDPVQEKALHDAEKLRQKAETHTVKHPFKEDDKTKLVNDITDISKAFAKVSGGAKPGDLPDPVWKPKRGTGGKYKPTVVTVDQLSQGKVVAGSSPENVSVNSNVTGWSRIVQAGLTTDIDKWVQMHLINEKLGGEGKPYNLVPGPNSVNSGTMRSFEGVAKRLVHEKPENVAWLKTTVKYRSGAQKAYAESVTMQAGLYLHKGGKEWVKDPKPKVQDVSAVPTPDFSKAKIPSLSSSSGTFLRSIVYKSESYAFVFSGTNMKRIKAVRKAGAFTTMADFESRMNAYVPPEIKTATGLTSWRMKVASEIVPNVQILHNARKLKVR